MNSSLSTESRSEQETKPPVSRPAAPTAQPVWFDLPSYMSSERKLGPRVLVWAVVGALLVCVAVGCGEQMTASDRESEPARTEAEHGAKSATKPQRSTDAHGSEARSIPRTTEGTLPDAVPRPSDESSSATAPSDPNQPSAETHDHARRPESGHEGGNEPGDPDRLSQSDDHAAPPSAGDPNQP